MLISTRPDVAFREGWRVRRWDLLFYATFGVVVASSVRIGGVLLVFSYLIVPSLAGIALGRGVGSRLVIGWAFGIVVSVLGMIGSAALDLPTGASIVCAFGAALLAVWLMAPSARAAVRKGRGPRAAEPARDEAPIP
jgi:zinc/manganese transport system permease protein